MDTVAVLAIVVACYSAPIKSLVVLSKQLYCEFNIHVAYHAVILKYTLRK